MPLVSLIHELMGTGNAFEAIDVVEFGSDFVAEQPARTSWAYSPCAHFLRVAPDKVTEGTLVRDLLGTSDNTDLIESADLGTEAAVYAEDFAIDERCKGKEVEDLTCCFPHRCVAILLLALFVESVHLGDLARFVVPSDKRDPVWVPFFKSVSI